MSSIPINYTLTQTSNITSMKIEVTQLILFTSSQFRVTFYDENNNIVKSQILNMSLGEYQQWCENDEYVVQWVKQQLEIN
jgi:hypothetical protein